MTSKLTLTESMSQLRQRLLTIEQSNVDEGKAIQGIKDLAKTGWEKLTGKAAEEALLKELGEKVTITNEKGQVQTWILQHDDKGIKYHLEGGDARISPEDMKARKAAEPRKEPSIPPEATEPHPTLLGPDGKPLQVPAKPKAAAVDPVVKAIENVAISTDHPDITNMGRLDQYLRKERPELMSKLDQNPVAKKKFYENVVTKSKTKKVIAIAAIIALLIYFLKDHDTAKTDTSTTANAGSKMSSEGESPIGTNLPANEIPWKWVITGSTDPNVNLDTIKNAQEVYDGVRGQSLTKNKDGRWQTSNNKVLKTLGKSASRIEELVNMPPEKRKEMANAENTLTFNNVELHRDELPTVAPVEADSPNKAPDTSNPDIVLAKNGKCPAGYQLSKDGKTCEKEVPIKKKKKDEKVLPSSNW